MKNIIDIIKKNLTNKNILIIVGAALVLLIIGIVLVLGTDKVMNGGKDSKKIYTVTFNTNGGTSIESIKVSEDENFIFPEVPTRSGYQFDAWLYEGEPFYDNIKLTKDITIEATWIKLVE